MSSLNAGDRRHKLMNDKQRHSLYILFYLIHTEIYDEEYFFRFSEKKLVRSVFSMHRKL